MYLPPDRSLRVAAQKTAFRAARVSNRFLRAPWAYVAVLTKQTTNELRIAGTHERTF
jgi:hypothetical protein